MNVALSCIHSPILRRDLLMAFHKSLPKNAKLIQQIVDVKNGYAKLCGKANYMEYEMNNTLITKASDVHDFCTNILHALQEYNSENYREVQEEKNNPLGQKETLQYWDYYLYKGSVNARKEAITYKVRLCMIVTAASFLFAR